MKNLVKLFVVAGLFTFVACGPSAEEKAEQARQDSIRVADSLALVQAEEMRIQDSIAFEEARIAAEKAVADSIAAAEVAAKAKGGKKK
jgi:hypothetical protein